MYQIFQELEATNSVVRKAEILKLNSDNENFKLVLKLALDPYTLFHMNKLPDFELNKSGVVCFKKFFQLCEKLSKKTLVGNEAKKEVKDFLESQPEEYAKLFAKVISKSSIGVGAKTINKVWPNLVPKFDLMLAPNKIPDLASVHYPCVVQPKLDGYRCLYIKGKLFSRAGKPFGNKNLQPYFNSLESVKGYVLDGELYVHGINFNSLTKILNAEDAKLPNNLKYYVYDCVGEDSWFKQSKTPSYKTRLSRARELLNDTICDYAKIVDTPSHECDTPGEALEIYKKYLQEGYEGVMIKNVNGSYQWKRVTLSTGEMVKLKPYTTLDLVITDIYEGEGKFKGMAGGVVVDNAGVSVRVGTGFDDITRKEMAESPNNFIGKTVEIRYFEKTPDGSLRHPSFCRFRPEKD